MRSLLITSILIVTLQPTYATDYFDWQSNITNSCQATISGRAKGAFSRYGFWFDTAVSMDMWAEFSRNDPPQEYCKINYASHRDKVKYMQCIAYIQGQWDWYNRCKPIVDQLSREESRRK